jgi:uncharacterized protein (TIGR03000 family)
VGAAVTPPPAKKAAADPSTTPVNETEKAMVRELLQKYRSGTKKSEAPGAPAQLTIRLPADAALYIDNQRCPLTSNVRSFATPNLELGRKYFYTLRAEIVRDGQTITENRRVIVAAGQQVNVEFGQLMTAQR